ncbi:venom factor-like [Bufo gargarizans]|uniref:venom factor-like n=1 Tax=Bufo gargarizans TaxID=30331 RepID=UPI001CF2C6E7|nr:venom factor-like [Bufo gargarizans]
MGLGALCLLLLYGLIGSYAQQPCSLITPNVLRVDSEETIIVDGHGSALDAEIIVYDFPLKKSILVLSKVSVNSNNRYFGDVKLTIPSNNLEKYTNKKQFVYVTVKSATCSLEKVVLVNFQSGYLFIQTDKPIYTPGSKVLFRIFTVNPELKPVSKRVITEFLTPNNVIVEKYVLYPNRKTGIISYSHKLTDLVSFGLWTISAKFENTLTKYTTQFEMKEYVQPSFEIKVTSPQKFFYFKDKELRVDITATFLHGEPVKGNSFVLFGLKRDNEKKSLPNTLRRVDIDEGEGFAILKREDLVKYFQEERDMLQWTLFVSVTVITDSGSDMAEYELNNIFIVESPYKILYTKTSKYFKPGMPFDLKVFVTYPDGSPAHRVPVVAESGNVRGTTLEDGTARLTLNTRPDMNLLQITVSTLDEKIPKEKQASATMVASAYRSTGGNYLYLSVIGGELKPGENAIINFIIRNNDNAVQNQISHFNYVIMNKGRIMKVGTKAREKGHILVTMSLPITEEFIPSFRILAYYTVTTGADREIVADSVWIDVEDTCMGTLVITGDKDKDNAVQQPGAPMKLKLQADHKATVGLVAVDKGVSEINNKLKISQRKIWDLVEKYDIGCTPGSGANAPGVFYDAGLALQTSFQMTTSERSEPLCQPNLKRRRRSSGLVIQERNKRADYEDEIFIDDDEIITRTEFPESWLWRIEEMNEAPDPKGISTKTIPIFLKDSTTTWEVLAVSLSDSKGKLFLLVLMKSTSTSTGSDMAEYELNNIFIVESPYKILYTKTSKYFKPGMPFDLKVFVTYPDGSPAHRVPVVAESGNVRGTTLEDGTARLTLNTRPDMNLLQITVSTLDEKIPKEKQASATMVASAYRSTGGNYLYLSVIGGELKPGENAIINFIIRNNDNAVQNQISHFNYVIMNKGRIMKVGTQAREKGHILVTMSLPITEEFIPSFRILAYYTVTTGADREIVADSVWIDVEDTCMGTLVITGDKDKDNAVQQPGAPMKLKLQADHKATVGLVAVDKGVSEINNKLKISQRKIWDLVEKYDIGCTPGSGANAPGVFYDAGLALQTSFQMTTSERSEPLCQPNLKRRRRSSGLVIQERNKRADYEDEIFIDDDEIITRTEFPESWLWRIEEMNEAPDPKGISTKTIPIFLKDSTTTWEVLAVSLSDSKGICVSKPHNIEVRKDFFIDLKLPYSVVRNEQVEIRAILYNYQNIRLKVRVHWTYNKNFCSLSSAKKKFRQEVEIQPYSSVVVPFIVIPLTLGNHDIEVKATSEYLSDGVQKKLFVVPEGRRLTQMVKSVGLEPGLNGGVQEERISVVNPQNIVPNTQVDTIITIQGHPVGEMVEESIDGVHLDHLIEAPVGSGEGNMLTITTSLIATHYLDFSNQWHRLGLLRREQAFQYIKNGVARQLTYVKADGSYGTWANRPSSTWLTAYVVKVFSLASRLVDIQKNAICDPVKWLILNKQNPDGKFREDFHVYHQEMVGGITKGAVELDSRLTAFVLIALVTSEETCNDQINFLPRSIEKAVQYLNDHYHSLKKPYSIAITSYALAKAGKLEDSRILMAASTGSTHWEDPGSHFLTLEATSYALLTLLKLKEFEKAGPLVKWLTEQRYYGKIWGSTQSTMMQFEALAQYQMDVPAFKDLDMDVSLKLPKIFEPTNYHLSLENALVARSKQINELGDVIVTAKGKGQATLTVLSIYYAFETEKKCKNFDLSVKIQEEPDFKRPEGTYSTVSVTICARFLKNHDATMSIIDMSMMTGFKPDINDLIKLKTGVDRNISNFEINKGAFDKGTLIIYIDHISHTKDECLKFHLHQYFQIGLIQPGSVTVYDYYTPENRCTKFYHLEEGSKLLGKICKGDLCHCAGESCFMQQQLGEVKALDRLHKACEPAVDYVYKATLTTIEKGDNYDIYVMTITTVIKEGTDENVDNQKRNFISHAKCSKALNLEKGKDYVIWGVRKDLWNTADGYAYMITKDTWIEISPNNRDCQKAEFKNVCNELEEFIDEMDFRGCTS